MDATERLVWDADGGAVVGVLGLRGQFVLVPLSDTVPIPDAVMEDAHHRGLRYCGVLALVGGEPRAKCEPDLDAAHTMLLASLSFAQQVADKIKQHGKGDEEDWLRRLYNLPDTREN